ncbi:MAG: TrkA C-terminal domain-containing protein, partial [Candidatus Neomarinimicrobiota bacterium]|nr:TrkA C-terminal domain-containing protein [Candidatus Neomarinimicrobiota bacterium]
QPDVDCLVTKKPIKELDFPKDSIVGMINHHGKIQIPHGNSKLSADDTVLVFTKPHSINKLKKMFDA